MKYSEIKTLEDLEKAQQDVKARLSGQKDEIGRRVVGVRDSFAPANLFAGGLRAVSGRIPLDRIALRLVRNLITRLR